MRGIGEVTLKLILNIDFKVFKTNPIIIKLTSIERPTENYKSLHQKNYKYLTQNLYNL